MNRIFVAFIALVTGCMAAVAGGLTAKEAFASAPSSVFPLLDGNTRLDMIDYFESGMSTPSTNALKGQSAITSMTDRELTVRMTDSSTAQVAILASGADDVIAVISTVATPGLDSNVSFYDSAWKPLPTEKYFSKPALTDWLSAEGKGHAADVEMQVPFMLASGVIDSQGQALTLTNNLDKFLDKDFYAMISAYLSPTMVFDWNGKKFVRRK